LLHDFHLPGKAKTSSCKFSVLPEAAAAAGFADQAHCGRWCRRMHGITRGMFARAQV
jgi:hypothetical protein